MGENPWEEQRFPWEQNCCWLKMFCFSCWESAGKSWKGRLIGCSHSLGPATTSGCQFWVKIGRILKVLPRNAAPGSLLQLCPLLYWLLLVPLSTIHEGGLSFRLLPRPAIPSFLSTHCPTLVIWWAARHVVFSHRLSLWVLPGAQVLWSLSPSSCWTLPGPPAPG